MQRSMWIAVWAVAAIAATFVEAIARLGARAAAELGRDLTGEQWAVLVVLTVAMTYIEGYRALQRRFAPSVVARAFDAGRRADRWPIGAPLYAVSLVGAPPKVITRSIVGIAMIVICVFAVRALPAPWRGIVDAAVATALGWGLLALVACFVSALAAQRTPHVDEARPAAVSREAI